MGWDVVCVGGWGWLEESSRIAQWRTDEGDESTALSTLNMPKHAATHNLLAVNLLFLCSFLQDFAEKPLSGSGGSSSRSGAATSSTAAAYSRVAPLDDNLLDPWADARTQLASGSADVSSL